jgi:hypothetical protein
MKSFSRGIIFREAWYKMKSFPKGVLGKHPSMVQNERFSSRYLGGIVQNEKLLKDIQGSMVQNEKLLKGIQGSMVQNEKLLKGIQGSTVQNEKLLKDIQGSMVQNEKFNTKTCQKTFMPIHFSDVYRTAFTLVEIRIIHEFFHIIPRYYAQHDHCSPFPEPLHV